jgi:hypothetical protein
MAAEAESNGGSAEFQKSTMWGGRRQDASLREKDFLRGLE